MKNQRESILFIVTFGAGLGHMAREISIATKLRQLSEETEIIFYTTSPATDALYSAGFYYYYVPSKIILPGSVSISAWEKLYEQQLNAIVKLHRPKAIIYDGPYPEASLVRILVENPRIKGIWVKREGDRKDVRSVKSFERFFDLLIVPKELGEENRQPTDKCKIINPIIYESRQKPLFPIKELFPEYKKGRNRLWYVQLGAGIINKIDDVLMMVQKMLLRDKENYVLIGISPVGRKEANAGIENARCRMLRSFPNSIYFDDIDYAISAAGYNTFYELIYYGIPSIFIPNQLTGKDDQAARAKSAEEMGIGLIYNGEKELHKVIECLCRNKNNYRERLITYHFQNGAMEAAELILQYT